MNTSPPRMFSLKRTETSPSSKRDDVGVAERHLELVADRLRQASARVPREDPARIHVVLLVFGVTGPRPGNTGAIPVPRMAGAGGSRTSGCEIQSLVPYRLATPHQQNGISVTVRTSSVRGDGNWPRGIRPQEKSRRRLAGRPRGVKCGRFPTGRLPILTTRARTPHPRCAPRTDRDARGSRTSQNARRLFVYPCSAVS